jgi:uncharacterized protein
MFDSVLTALQSIDTKLELAVVFGSVVRGEARFDSDIDVAVRYTHTLNPEEKIALIEALALTANRPVDLIDLRVAGPVVSREALTKGKRIFGSDEVWAEQVSRTLIDYADFAPLVERTLRERQNAWIRA